MLARVPPAQRRMLILVAAAAVAAGIFVGVAILLASGRPAVRPGRYEPFVAGNAATLGQMVATEQPIFYADPTGGTRGFALFLEGGDFVALHVVPPGGSTTCPIDWDRGDDRFEDCEGTPLASDELRRFKTEVTDGVVIVDLRTIQPPPRPTG